MACEYCDLKIGDVISLSGACYLCASPIFFKDASYVGRMGDAHVCRVHPTFKCSGCDTIHRYAMLPCKDFEGIDVTDEYVQAFMSDPVEMPDEHWIGKNARG